MNLLIRKINKFTKVIGIRRNELLLVHNSKFLIEPAANLGCPTNSIDDFNFHIDKASSVKPLGFDFKTGPSDLNNDLYNQLNVGPVDGDHSGFTLLPGHLYHTVRRSPTDYGGVYPVLQRLQIWNRFFCYFLRISFFMRVVLSRLDHLFGVHLTEMQIIVDNLIEKLPVDKQEKLERRMRQILSGVPLTDTHYDLYHLMLKSRNIIIDYDSYDTTYLINWMTIYLNHGNTHYNPPTPPRLIDDELLYKYGSVDSSFLLHLGCLKALDLTTMEKSLREKSRVVSHERDLVGYLHAYLNLLASPTESKEMRSEFAGEMMKTRLQFLTEERGELAFPKRYDNGDYYECMEGMLNYLPKQVELDRIPHATVKCNLAVRKLYLFSFEPDYKYA